ncbi:MAG: serine/threonine protein kinase [Archangium sp.]|nr:serine/threonine protein kinase [Archangium sp.]
MAEVWLAKQTTGLKGINKHVVIKRILPHLAQDPEFLQMFENEAKVAMRFNHPNIAQIYEFGQAKGAYFIAMEYVHGEDLGRVMRRAAKSGQWPSRAISLRIIADACAGLYYAHTRTDDAGKPLKVVHRDISPQNILVSFDGTVKVVDFGIAKAADQSSQTKAGTIKGKFAYMAPEHAGGLALDARSDIFSIGLVLYELLTATRPLKRGNDMATLQAAIACEIQPPSEASDTSGPEVDGVVMKAIAKSVDARYRDARQFQMALEQFLVTEGTLSTSVQVAEMMESLFADRLAEEARVGAPAPASKSSASNLHPSEDEEGPQQINTGDLVQGNSNPKLTVGDVPRRKQAAAEVSSKSERSDARSVSKRKMPDAPPRRTQTPKPLDVDVQHTAEDLPRVGNQLRKRKPTTPWGTIAAVAFLVVIAGVAFMARSQLFGLVGAALPPVEKGTPLKLTARSSPRTKVVVLRPGSATTRELGFTPLEGVSGAYAGDLVQLLDEERGLLHAQRVDGAADAPVTVEKTFREATLKVRTKPALKSASVWRAGVNVGSVGLAMQVFEGTQRLQLRSESLSKPVEFEVEVAPGGVVEREVDVSGALTP